MSVETAPPIRAAGRRALGFLLSFVLPGAGHVLLGRGRRGLALLAVFFASWLSIPLTRLVGWVALTPLYLVIAFDVLFIRARVRPSFGRLALAWVALFAGLVTMRAAILRYYVTSLHISADSVAMRPTLLPEENVFMAPYRRRPARGDVILYHPARSPGDLWVHRVIGVGGDQLVVGPDGVLLNGAPLATGARPRCAYAEGPCREERLGEHRYVVERDARGPLSDETIRVVVPPGELFVMGDNRDHSVDSRTEGTVPLDRVVSTALFVWWSATPQFECRWERFGLVVR